MTNKQLAIIGVIGMVVSVVISAAFFAILGSLTTSPAELTQVLKDIPAVNMTTDEVKELTAPTVGGNTFTVEHEWLGNNSATTTKIFLTSGAASSTTAFNCDNAESIDLNLMSVASSTATVLNWTYEFSDDNIDWFYQDGFQIVSTSAVTHGAGPILHSWTPNTTSEINKNVSILPVASKYCRISIGATGADGSIWGGIILKRAY